MSAAIDHTGENFGCLTVIQRVYGPTSRATWLCQCECGVQTEVIGQYLRRRLVTSCGCKKAIRFGELGKATRTHGRTNTPEFRCWIGILSRCTNYKDYRYKNYGGRGITVCDRWREIFEAFLEDVGERPFPGAELDRADNDGDYEPGNVRWVTSSQNNNNRRSNRRVEHRGMNLTLSQWEKETGIAQATIRVRLEAGWTVDRALTQPVRGRHGSA